MRKNVKTLTAAAVILAIVLAGIAGGYFWCRSHYVMVDGVRYNQKASQLDLLGKEITLEHYQHIQKALPDCTILWNVPFQQRSYASNTEKISISSLTKEDVEMLRYLPNLKQVDATNCFDYQALHMLREALPECQIDYCVAFGNQIIPMDAQELTLQRGEENYEELSERLAYLPQLKQVSFVEPELTPQELDQLLTAYPDIDFKWTKTVFGQTLPNDTEELDISGMKFETVEDIENQAGYLSGLKKLIMCDTGLENDDIAAYRERARSKYKVVWNVKIGQFNVRTDETWFMPTKFHKDVKDSDMRNMKYCEDMICIDLGHNVMKNIDWVRGTPHLKYLIIADCPLRDIQALGTLKELKFLELFMTDIRDISPLLGCTALEDLNVARIPANLRPLAEMKWLKNLWMSGGRVSKEDEAYLREQLPNTRIDAALHHNCTGRGWRQLQNYIDMRNILDMPIFAE